MYPPSLKIDYKVQDTTQRNCPHESAFWGNNRWVVILAGKGSGGSEVDRIDPVQARDIKITGNLLQMLHYMPFMLPIIALKTGKHLG